MSDEAEVTPMPSTEELNQLEVDLSRKIAEELRKPGRGRLGFSMVVFDGETGRPVRMVSTEGPANTRLIYVNLLTNMPDGERMHMVDEETSAVTTVDLRGKRPVS